MTAEISPDPWATLDELLGVEPVAEVDVGIGALAFYGRCSTEDNQDPETSLGWQLGNARKFVEPLGGRIVAEFFDVGQSRSVPWNRREEASRLLAELKRPDRGWDAVVVGEGTRCWFGNQFSLTAPRFAAYDVGLWVPELGGQFDSRNPSHKMLMSVLGGMSESERQHVQARVRAAMDAQVINEGRHQGGRAPYGYVVVDGGAHPNPRKAAEGYRLRVLAIDEPSADVVRRIFDEYLDGKGDRAIANGLNLDGIPCPSARRPDQNRHRLADGWQGSTVRAILDNPRYTGYAIFGRWTKHETLLDPDDVAAGHVIRFRRSTSERVVRSRHPAHPAGWRPRAKPNAAAGQRRDCPTCCVVGCGAASASARCRGAPIRQGVYYRCLARTLAPGSAALADHPRTVNLREDLVREPLNGWIGHLFDRDQVDHTVAAFLASQETATEGAGRDGARRRLAEAEARLRRHQAAIEAGVDPAALVEVINKAHAGREAARAELASIGEPTAVDEAEVYAMIDSLGDVGAKLNGAKPTSLARLYEDLGLQLRYEPLEQAIYAEISPRVVSARVRGRSCTLFTRRRLSR